jgi:Na+/H+ antiporter NhaC
MPDPVTEQLALLGIKTSTLIAGFSGGLAHYYLVGGKNVAKSPTARALDALMMGGVGSFFAIYIAPLVLHYYSFPREDVEISTGIGFIVGLTGLYIGHGIVRLAAGWAEKPSIPPKV